MDHIAILSKVERHDASLPRFVVVPGADIEGWRLSKTTVVEVSLNGELLGRRSLKPWGSGGDTWFFDLTSAHCARLGIDTGDTVEVCLRPADAALPPELRAVLEEDGAAKAKWNGLSEARRRAISEHIREAKGDATRLRRARRALAE